MNKGQNGNILFIIIVAIGLLAALMMSLSKSERYSDNMDREDMILQIRELYTYGQTLEKALNKVMLQNGCDIVELTFDHPDLANYNTSGYYLNPNSPADKHCHIFEPEGGGVKYQTPPEMSQALGADEYGIIINTGIKGVGGIAETNGAGSDLMLHTRVTKNACLQINKDQNITNTGDNPPYWASGYLQPIPYAPTRIFPCLTCSGTDGFTNGYVFANGAVFPELKGKKIGCYHTGADDIYNFYYVLLAR